MRVLAMYKQCSIMKDAQLLAIANNYRDENNKPEGIVLIWEGSAYGWKDTLRNPDHERPGAIAVDADGNIFEAQGGDDYSGSKLWIKCG